MKKSVLYKPFRQGWLFYLLKNILVLYCHSNNKNNNWCKHEK